MKLVDIAALMVRFVAILVLLGGVLLAAVIHLLSSFPKHWPMVIPDLPNHDTYYVSVTWHGSALVLVVTFVVSVIMYGWSRPLGRLLAKGLGDV